MPYSVREGINIFLAGFIPTENMRFRDEELTFKVTGSDTGSVLTALDEKSLSKPTHYKYPRMSRTLDVFKLEV
jgi:ATP-binding cassette subfamily E protein 1